MKTFFSLLIIVLLSASTISAQHEMSFRHLNTKDGLSNNSVRDIVREQNGLLWIGTANGINRYDGYHFKTYKLETKEGKLCTDIWYILKDDNDNIIVCASGVNFSYNRANDTFIELDDLFKQKGLPTKGNRRVLLTANGNYWIFSDQGAWFYDRKTQQKRKVITNGQLPESCAAIGETVFATLRDNHIYITSPQSHRQSTINMPENAFPNNSTKQIFIDRKGGLWVSSYSTNNILYRSETSKEWKTITLSSKFQSAQGITRICQDNYGQIIVASDHQGLFIINPLDFSCLQTTASLGDNNGLPTNNISTIYVDQQNTIWLGHNKNGISYTNEAFDFVHFHRFNSFSDVSNIFKDSRNVVWIGTDGQGLYQWNMSAAPIKMPLPNMAYIATTEDRQGRIWTSTYNGGIYILKGGRTEKFLSMDNSKLISRSSWGLIPDNMGYIWVFSTEGVQRINSQTLEIKDVNDDNGMKIIALSMTFDGKSSIYVGTIDGVVTINTATLQRNSIKGNRNGTKHFAENAVSQIYVSDDILWIGSNNGISVYDIANDDIQILDKRNGLTDNTIRAIGENQSHNIIVTTTNGLSIINVSRDGDGKLHLSCRNMTAYDGIGNAYFNAFALCDINSSVLCGNADGITELDEAKSAMPSLQHDTIFIAEAYVGGQSLPISRNIKIGYNDGHLKLVFSTPDIIGAHNIHFAYMIEEKDAGWQTMTDNTLSLLSLSPGTYKLHIKATNRYGQWGKNEMSLTITVMPPFYRTWWAYLIYILCIVSTVYLYIRRVKRHQTRHLEHKRREIVYENQQKTDKMKIDFFVSLSHDLRTPLMLILTPIQMLRKQKLPEAIGRKLDVIEENANRLNEMISTIMDYRKVEAGDTLNVTTCDLPLLIREVSRNFERQANYNGKTFIIDCEPKQLTFSFDRQKMKRTLENLFSNATKYTEKGDTIGLTMRRHDNDVYICVYDTGKGIKDDDKTKIFNLFFRSKEAEQKSGTGIGLYLVDNYVKMHGGKITVKDHLPHGTEFEMTIPLRGVFEESQMEEVLQTDIEQNIEQEQDLAEDTADHKINLLIVDDNKQICELFVEELSDTYNVISAYDGEQALRLLYSNNIDIVVTDVAMPVMDGIQLCKNIKEDINISHIPVIMLTAKITDNEKMEGLTAGADEYLCKPVNIDILRLRIEKIMEWKANSQKMFNSSMEIEPSKITITHIDEELVKKAIYTVEQHIGDFDFSVEQLGSELGMSRSHLYKKMMAIIGKSPNEFIHTLRMKRARQLLEESGMNVSEVAYAVGFSSPRRFTICFKKEFGDIPSSFMKKSSN